MKVSDCCGAAPAMIGDYDCDTEEFGICPECRDHCEYIDDEEYEDMYNVPPKSDDEIKPEAK